MDKQPRPTERREVRYRGRVQGVGFRYTARSISADYDVTGYVKNLPDGRVELVAEGEPGELDAFLADVVRQMGRNIAGVDIHTGPATGGFVEFDIQLY